MAEVWVWSFELLLLIADVGNQTAANLYVNNKGIGSPCDPIPYSPFPLYDYFE